MDSFDECGIRYLTPSSINAYRANPAYWVMRYLYGEQTTSPAFLRSIAVKAGIKAYLSYRGEIGRAEDVVLETYWHRIGVNEMPWNDPGVQDEYDNLLPMFHETVKGLTEMDLIKIPTAMDLPTSVWADGVTAPFLSSPDIVFDDCVVDLKPTKACPSKIPERDLVAMAIHDRARSLPVYNVYATAKKHAVHTSLPGQLDSAWLDLVVDAHALQTFVLSAESREHALAMLPLNRDHYYWSPEALDRARGVLKLTQERMNGLNNAAGTRRLREAGAGDPSGDLLPDY